MKFSEFKISTLYLLLSISATCFADKFEIIKPEVVGYCKSQDCYEHEPDKSCPFDYENYAIGKGTELSSSIDEVVIKFSKKLPYHQECSWELKLEKESLQPKGFPFGQANNFFNEFKAFRIIAYCKRHDDQSAIDYGSETAYPVFLCPNGYKFNDTIGCARYTKEICSGDIVARKMSTSFLPLADQGHVGVIFNFAADDDKSLFPGVVEILNNKYVLNFTPLEKFKSASPNGYWGEKYGVNKSSHLTNEQFGALLMGIAEIYELQKNGTQLRYTLSSTPTYNPLGSFFIYDATTGKWLQNISRPSVSFRCDSFVKYVYEKARDIHFNLPLLTPRNLFRSLHVIRNGRDPLFSAASEISYTPQSSEKYLKELFIDNKYDDNYESVIREYVNNDFIPEREKISFLIDLLYQVRTDQDKFVYIIDLLIPMRPFRFFNDFKDIDIQDNKYINKHYISVLLQESIKFSSREEISKLSPSDISTIVEIQNYLKKRPVYNVRSIRPKKFFRSIEKLLKIKNKYSR